MRIPIQVSEENREPIYHQVETQIKALIVGGKLPPGTPLPSIRALASDLGCSVITTRRTYQNLQADGFIQTIQGKGTFVREMESTRMEKTKQKVVYEAFEKAIQQGKQVGFSKEDMKAIFSTIIKKNFTNGG
ncbi:GntR family transcriptional regulator [Salinibacillus kushneri]|uniref:GntR family transcriptional regulator n=1 Tax=Salinibacillus kushneri TaxID=237682 RepID=A0A1I0F777_9BACI|nr:GntR family transcriptional regulator [Salinibacillus kushneri]SET53707.1 GntR family transcriptional regulator [Salinibacillus kushneri]